jgi:diguanylate cyclase (GGDEF)-like protein/PAS domain S-box-containing protein
MPWERNMQLDIQTLALISTLTFLTQFIALFVQYMVDRTYRAVIWWLLGATTWGLGVIFMPMVAIPALEILARIANPLVVLGYIFLYNGVLWFLGQKTNRWGRILFFLAFLFLYYYFMFASNNLSARTIVVTVAMGTLSFIIASRLFLSKDRPISVSVIMTGITFLVYGCFSAVRILITLFSPPIQSYADQRPLLELSFVIPIICSSLWTFGFIIMLNQRLNAENRGEKEKLQLIFHMGPDAAVILRLADGLIVDVNDSFLSMSGYTRAELIHQAALRMNIWHDPADREALVREIKETGACENREFVFQRKDGSLLVGSMSAKTVTIQAVPHIISMIHDITQSKQAEEAMRESEELYRSILNASPDDITITDMQGRIRVVSPAAKKMFGFGPEDDGFLGSQLLDFIVPEDRERAKSNILRMLKGESVGPNEYHGLRQDQSLIDIEVNSGSILGANRQPAKMAFVVRDITERKQAEQQIKILVQQLEVEKKREQLNANTDSLTGLANRRYFDETLKVKFQRLQGAGDYLSIIMLDVDHFKKFNDQYGHLAGDDCLRQIGIVLNQLVRHSTDVVARYGGEEFIVILPKTDSRGAFILAERIRKSVLALAIPHADSDISEYVTVSLGVATMTADGQSSPEQAVALADAALYCAKNGGRNRCAGNPEMVGGTENPAKDSDLPLIEYLNQMNPQANAS